MTKTAKLIEAVHPVVRKAKRKPGYRGNPVSGLCDGDCWSFPVFHLIAIGNQEQEVFSSARSTLDLRFGLANTPSAHRLFFVAIGVERYRLNDGRDNRIWFRLAILSGVIFLINKVFEWNAKVSDGLTPMTNDFYVFLCVHGHSRNSCVCRRCHTQLSAQEIASPFTGNTTRAGKRGHFLHLVDLLWIMLFALFYLV